MSNDLAGYFLGFPIQWWIPSDEQIANAIGRLCANEEQYLASVREYVRTTHATTFGTNNPRRANETNVLMDDIDDYAPFDIVVYQNGDHIYRFTREEFSTILESKKNPWSNEFLPPSILATMSERHSVAKQLGLPKCRPLKEILSDDESVLEGAEREDAPAAYPITQISHQIFEIRFQNPPYDSDDSSDSPVEDSDDSSEIYNERDWDSDEIN